MADEQDPNNPLDAMFPSRDGNPKYEKLKREHEEGLQSSAEQGVVSDPALGGMAERMQRVRKTNPQAAPPTPMPPVVIPQENDPPPPPPATGVQVDPEMAQVQYTPVEPRLPEGAVPAAPAAPQPPPVAAPSLTDGSVSPVLAKLRQDFGIDNIPVEEVKLGDSIFSLRILDTGSVAMALRFAETLSVSAGESAINMQIACVSFSVQAIDGVPLWQVFSVPLEHDQKITVEGKERAVFAPMNPPSGMRIQAASQLMEFLSGDAAPSLVDELWKAYGEKVDPKGTLEGIVERIKAGEQEPEDIPLP